MKAKLITSGLFGICLPWLYFLIFRVGPIRIIDPNGVTTIGAGGVAGFIEFEGLFGSISIYVQSILVCSIIIFLACTVYDLVKSKS